MIDPANRGDLEDEAAGVGSEVVLHRLGYYTAANRPSQSELDDYLLHSVDLDKANALYEAMADMGLGWQIVGFFRRG